MSGGEAGLRREFRAWVRAHHPDAGGDPSEFATGLAAWRERLAPDTGKPPAEIPTEVSVFRTRGGLWVALRWWRRRRRRQPRVR